MFKLTKVMTDQDFKSLEKRLNDLEEKMKDKVKIPRKPRKPSEYNDFMKDFFSKNKDSKKTHRELFAEGAKQWSKNKK